MYPSMIPNSFDWEIFSRCMKQQQRQNMTQIGRALQLHGKVTDSKIRPCRRNYFLLFLFGELLDQFCALCTYFNLQQIQRSERKREESTNKQPDAAFKRFPLVLQIEKFAHDPGDDRTVSETKINFEAMFPDKFSNDRRTDATDATCSPVAQSGCFGNPFRFFFSVSGETELLSCKPRSVSTSIPCRAICYRKI